MMGIRYDRRDGKNAESRKKSSSRLLTVEKGG